MKILTSFASLYEQEKRNIVFALGTFDGMHRGHQAVIQEAAAKAAACEAAVVVVTFDAHPFSLLDPGRAPLLLSQPEDKLAILRYLGVDYVLMLPMTEALLTMEPEVFAGLMLAHDRTKAIVTGSNFTFGRQGRGTPELIRQLAEGKHILIDTLNLLDFSSSGTPISSTVIRHAVREGNMELAADLLGRPYGFTGIVVKGDQRGRLLGFPTINFDFPAAMVQPADGVYANRVLIDGIWYNGMGNVGDNPTFLNQYHRFEMHVFDFQRMIYGETVRIEFIAFLRGEKRFASVEELVETMKGDELKVKELLQAKGY